MAEKRLDFPDPFLPTTTLRWGQKSILVSPEKDLKPSTRRLSRYMMGVKGKREGS